MSDAPDRPDPAEHARLAALAELGAAMAHEVGNALTAMLTLVQVSRGGDGAAASLIEADLVRAITILERYVAAVDRRPMADAPSVSLDVRELAGGVCDLARHHLQMARVTLEVDLPAVGTVRGRDGELRQVLLNLILNARQAVAPGGRVRVSAARNGHGIELRVDDDGPGVPAALRERVFDRGYTARHDGTGSGRGLALSRAIARAHGGDIVVEDGPLGGAALVVRLPPED